MEPTLGNSAWAMSNEGELSWQDQVRRVSIVQPHLATHLGARPIMRPLSLSCLLASYVCVTKVRPC